MLEEIVMLLNSNEKMTLWAVGRLGGYFAILLGCVFSMWFLASELKTETFEEYGIVENIQLALLAITSFSFFLQALKRSKARSLCILLGMLFLAAFCRELDAWFDELWSIGWKFALIFPLIGLLYTTFDFKNFRKSVVCFCQSPAFFLVYCGAVIIIPIAQCIGHKSFFVNALGNTVDPRLVRRLFEESCEFIGYTLLFLASIEFFLNLIRKK